MFNFNIKVDNEHKFRSVLKNSHNFAVTIFDIAIKRAIQAFSKYSITDRIDKIVMSCNLKMHNVVHSVDRLKTSIITHIKPRPIEKVLYDKCDFKTALKVLPKHNESENYDSFFVRVAYVMQFSDLIYNSEERIEHLFTCSRIKAINECVIGDSFYSKAEVKTSFIENVYKHNDGLNIECSYKNPFTWSNISNKYVSWQEVSTAFASWEDVRTKR